MADRFIVGGQPALDVGTESPFRATPSAAAPPVPSRPPRASSDLPTLESTSSVLRARLALLAARPSPRAYLEVAATYREFGVDDRAFDYLARGLTAFPHDSALHDATARQWREWRLPAQALRHAHLAVRYAPASAAAHTTLGTVLWALGQHAAATAAFRRAADLAPNADFARHNLCHAERELGRPTRAGCDAVAPPDPGPFGR